MGLGCASLSSCWGGLFSSSSSPLQRWQVSSSLRFALGTTSCNLFSLSLTQPVTATLLEQLARPATRRQDSARARMASQASPAIAVPRATSRAARQWPPASVSALPCAQGPPLAPGEPFLGLPSGRWGPEPRGTHPRGCAPRSSRERVVGSPSGEHPCSAPHSPGSSKSPLGWCFQLE